MFKGIFKAVGKFFKNLFKDPFMLLTVGLAAFTVVGFAAAILEIAILSTSLSLYIAAAAIAAIAVGFELDWLIAALVIAAAVINIYKAITDWSGIVSSIFGSSSLAEAALNAGILGQAIFAVVTILGVAGVLRSLSENISLIEGISLVVSEVVEDLGSGLGTIIGGVGSGVGNVIGGAISGFIKSPFGMIAAGVLGFFVVKKVFGEDKYA